MILKNVFAVCVFLLPSIAFAQEIAPGKTGEELRDIIRENFTPTNPLSYSDAREKMFSDIDNDGGKVRLVYTGSEYTTSTTPNHTKVNTEHTWPQSKFKNGIKKWQMKTDLHHLYPTWSKVNSARGSFPFGEIPDTSTAKWWISEDHVGSIPTTDIDSYSESLSGVFEPREDHKGNVARSMFYFYTIYENRSINLTWFNPQIPTLLQWHFDDPVDATERERNEEIEDAQGNLNPFVLDESLATRIFGGSANGGGTTPSPFGASVAEGDVGVPGLRIRIHEHDTEGQPSSDSSDRQTERQPSDTDGIADSERRRGNRSRSSNRDTTNPDRRSDSDTGATPQIVDSSQDEMIDRALFPFEHFNKRNDEAATRKSPFASSVSGPDDGEIRIATFNIANFGATDEYKRSLIALTNILLETNADLICLQEIQPNSKGKAQVRRLTELLNEAAYHYDTKPYNYKISEKDGGDELTAFVWRKPVELDSSIESFPHDEDHDNDGTRSFQRVPQMAAFHADDFDFVVVNCHLYTKPHGNSSEGRIVENQLLAKWLKAVAASNGEQDVLVLGDLNRHLGNGGQTAWKKLMINNHAQFFRFPLLEAIKSDHPSFNPKTHRLAPTDIHSTTASKSKNIYDQIIISKGCYDQFVSDPEFNEDIGIVDFDNFEWFEWFTHNYELTSDYLSDHRPVWIDLQYDMDDDD